MCTPKARSGPRRLPPPLQAVPSAMKLATQSSQYLAPGTAVLFAASRVVLEKVGVKNKLLVQKVQLHDVRQLLDW